MITEKHDGGIGYLLRDTHTGALARILPWLGANCMELRLPAADTNTAIPVINDMSYLPKLANQPSRYGIPILFPWPSGIPGGAFMFQNQIVELNKPGGTKSLHHGYVNRAPWQVVRSDCDNEAAWLTCAIDSTANDNAAARYPSSYRLEVTWKLAATGFRITMEAQNTGQTPMPFGIGLHPYFTIPFGKNGKRENCRLTAAVGRQWDLDVIVPVKPGSPKPSQVFLDKPTFNAADNTGTAIDSVKFNHVYEARFDADNATRASVIDAANATRLTVTGSKDFGTWVFYTPPDRSAISLEPWTLAPNGFNLAAAGVENTGMMTLQPGQKWDGHVEIQCDHLGT